MFKPHFKSTKNCKTFLLKFHLSPDRRLMKWLIVMLAYHFKPLRDETVKSFNFQWPFEWWPQWRTLKQLQPTSVMQKILQSWVTLEIGITYIFIRLLVHCATSTNNNVQKMSIKLQMRNVHVYINLPLGIGKKVQP